MLPIYTIIRTKMGFDVYDDSNLLRATEIDCLGDAENRVAELEEADRAKEQRRHEKVKAEALAEAWAAARLPDTPNVGAAVDNLEAAVDAFLHGLDNDYYGDMLATPDGPFSRCGGVRLMRDRLNDLRFAKRGRRS